MHAIFLILAALTIAGASAAMGLRNLIHCVLALTLGFVGLALLYLSLGAQFVGFTQILVYVGAVAILAVFAIMMTRSAGPHPQPALSAFWITGCVTAGATFAVLAWAIIRGNIAAPTTAPPAVSTNQIGDALMHSFALPLEIMGLLLTAALIGAVIIAMPQNRSSK
ncbi:MAG TPA: NADH-quinone oxidoreductase subunit J [Granulicella sp.]|jgi:NADH-quinone oxidoreductase subunit J